MMKIKLGDTSIVKVNKMKIKNGTVVFLKSQKDITQKYDSKLKNLIRDNHRFVVLAHSGPRSQCVAIQLLSTSKYLNEEKGLGIKLSGEYKEYGNGKDVYMDSTNNIYLIRTNCIKEIAYNLNKKDTERVISDHFYFDSGNLKKGLEDDGIVNMNFEEFDYYFRKFKVSDINRQQELDKERMEDHLINLLNSSDKKLENYYNELTSDKVTEFPEGGLVSEYIERITAENGYSKIEAAREIINAQLYNLQSCDKKEFSKKLMEAQRKQYSVDKNSTLFSL